MTHDGEKRGGQQREHIQKGDKSLYVAWPATIEQNPALLQALKAFQAPMEVEQAVAAAASPTDEPSPLEEQSFRTKFPAKYRTMDGHMVRSRAEAMIDNWLYQACVVHAYERRLPIEEEAYCDFFIPMGRRVYIEYWGMKEDQKYAKRMEQKRELYKAHEFGLVELTDSDLGNLDDVLPKRLLRFEIPVL